MGVRVFYSSVSGNQELKKKQQRIEFVLQGAKISFELVDVAASTENKDLMRKLIGDNKAVPPQIFNGDDYCGDFEEFENAVEMENLKEFLKL